MAQFGSIREYVERLGGDGAIEKVLIANNGIGAVKAIRSLRRWAYSVFGDARAVRFVAMATPEDLRANAEFIRMADEIVDVPGGTNNYNYANVTLILEIADRWGCDAVWAGWGHASENPVLPESLAKTARRIRFIGPGADAMRALGDKIGSTIIAQSAGVPCIAWNGDGITTDYSRNGISDELYDRANVKTAAAALQESKRIGFPVMIKASEGGGGKGIRKVMAESEVEAAYRQVASEIPGSPIFVMKLAPRSRHLEVQLLADHYGNAIALNGRDCSVQRRHQKIIEEGPPVAASPDVWHEMERAAVSLAKAVGYANAGTVEYLFTVEDGGFYFLELNPRLQVEHPVTEMITGVNLPAAQLQVAMGIPLHRIPDVRTLYGAEPFGDSPIDFDTAQRLPPRGHCIAVRVTAENPDQGFKPTSGGIQELNFRSTPDVWGYFSVDSSGLVHEFADSQFGHLFANGVDREAARKNMVLALRELSIRGDIRTTVEYIASMMCSDDFVQNRIDTAWLDARIASGSGDAAALANADANRLDALMVVVCGAVVSALTAAQRTEDNFASLLRKGQYAPPELLETTRSNELIYQQVSYRVTTMRSGPTLFNVSIGDTFVSAEARTLADGGYLVSLHGRSHIAYAAEEPGGLRMELDGQTCIFTKPYDPSRLVMDSAGKLSRQLVADGGHVAKGDAYAEVEVMKMYMPLKAPEAGTVRWALTEGATLSPGTLVANLELDDPAAVEPPQIFGGDLSALSSAADSAALVFERAAPHRIVRRASHLLQMVIGGFAVPEPLYQQALDDLLSAIADPTLALCEFEEALSVLAGRLDATLFQSLADLANGYRAALSAASAASAAAPPFPAEGALALIDAHGEALLARGDAAGRGALLAATQALADVCAQYVGGPATRAVTSLAALMRAYLQVERIACGVPYAQLLQVLRAQHAGDDDAEAKVMADCRSHLAVRKKNALVSELLGLVSAGDDAAAQRDAAAARRRETLIGAVGSLGVDEFVPMLSELANLSAAGYASVSVEARRCLARHRRPSVEQRRRLLQDAVHSALGSEDPAAPLDDFAAREVPITDILLPVLRGAEPAAQCLAMEAYVRKIYCSTHTLRSVQRAREPFPSLRFVFTTQAFEGLSPHKASLASSSFADLSELIRSEDSLQSAGERPPPAARPAEAEAAEDPPVDPDATRVGMMAAVDDFGALAESLPSILSAVDGAEASGDGAVNAVHVLVLAPTGLPLSAAASDDALSVFLKDACAASAASLAAQRVRRVTFVTPPLPRSASGSGGASPAKPLGGGAPSSVGGYHAGIFTYRVSRDCAEDQMGRHIEPSLAYHLMLPKLANFRVAPVKQAHLLTEHVSVYEAAPRDEGAGDGSKRYFVRAAAFCHAFSATEVERVLVECLNGLDVVEHAAAAERNHVFLNVVAAGSVLSVATLGAFMYGITERYGDKLRALKVKEVELKVTCKVREGAEAVPVWLVASDPTGLVLKVDTYVQTKEGERSLLRSVGGRKGELDSIEVTAPYPVSRPLDSVRAKALRSSGTLYAYDWLEVFEAAVEDAWRAFEAERPRVSVRRPPRLIESAELVVRRADGAGDGAWDADDISALEIAEVSRPPGQNDVGMVAWIVTLFTPEAPAGRRMVLIANDITYKVGSFGTREDAVFFLASEHSRRLGLPRLYLAANSGARIGMAESIKACFRVAWRDEGDPTSGFRYLYLSPADYEANKGYVKAELMLEGADVRFRITDITGREPDLGVENLMGSGRIAGESSRAYSDVFTLTLVVGRTVGIGAYLVRLGQRTIQSEQQAPIILTGYQALNKLMGKAIYTSNDQLGGGPEVMYPNGVTHLLARNHRSAVQEAVKWLGYVPPVKGGAPPLLDMTGADVVDRGIGFHPAPGAAYDPRFLVAGCRSDKDGSWQSGLFDRGSWTETLGGWAKSVVVGRARLGGVPVGVVITEGRTSECVHPADPADESSVERITQQAGGVWFPDSAFKTAQAIRDMNGEDLPLFIVANWRGFSGGQRDMFDEVLKFGADIVDQLVAYQQPVFVYIPPFAELRGGAWVVVDSTINASCMEMYADSDARGGVLEPNGAASIKFRARDQLKAMHRCDATLRALDAELEAAEANADGALATATRRRVADREEALAGIFEQIAVSFADLHDKPARMAAKGVIREEVPWQASRRYFYWRLRRRVAEFDLRRRVAAAQRGEEGRAPMAPDGEQRAKAIFVDTGNAEASWDDDRGFLLWYKERADDIDGAVKSIRAAAVAERIAGAAASCGDGLVQGVLQALGAMGDAEKAQFKAALQSAL